MLSAIATLYYFSVCACACACGSSILVFLFSAAAACLHACLYICCLHSWHSKHKSYIWCEHNSSRYSRYLFAKIHLFRFPNGIFVQFLCMCAPKRRYDVYYMRTNISLTFYLFLYSFQVSFTCEKSVKRERGSK